MEKVSSALILALSLVSTAVFSQSLKDAKVTYSSTDWKVLKSTDPMEDTTSCTGIYRDNYGVQLTPSALYIRTEGGVESVTLRFGDKPARSLRLASDMEKKIRSIEVTGADFAELEGSERLRYQVSTLVRGIKTDEIDLTGLGAVLEHIRAGCSSSPVPNQQVATPASLVGTLCSKLLVNRMKSQGLKDEQISAICQ